MKRSRMVQIARAVGMVALRLRGGRPVPAELIAELAAAAVEIEAMIPRRKRTGRPAGRPRVNERALAARHYRVLLAVIAAGGRPYAHAEEGEKSIAERLGVTERTYHRYLSEARAFVVEHPDHWVVESLAGVCKANGLELAALLPVRNPPEIPN